MTRADEISSLRRRYRQAKRDHKRLTMTATYLRLRHLIVKQLKAENRRTRQPQDHEAIDTATLVYGE